MNLTYSQSLSFVRLFCHTLMSLRLSCFSLLPPRLLHRYSIVTPSQVHRFDGVSMDYRWTIDGESMDYLRMTSDSNALDFPSCKDALDKRKRPDSCRYVQESDLRHILFMSVGSLFAIFCLLFGRTRTVSSRYVFLFLCLGLDLSFILLRLGASARE